MHIDISLHIVLVLVRSPHYSFNIKYFYITAPTSGFAYSLEALSEDEDVEEEETEEGEGRSAITQEQLAAALQVYIVLCENIKYVKYI